MTKLMELTSAPTIEIWTHSGAALESRIPELARFAFACGPAALSIHPAWLGVFHKALGHTPYALEARVGGKTWGFLPLSFVESFAFGKFLVSLPYLNSNGVIAASPEVQSRLISRAVELADEMSVKHLELRHEQPIQHSQLNGELTSKVHMRLKLPKDTEAFWKGLDSKVRNQVRKGEKNNFRTTWGGLDLLDSFYDVLARNMRDLGTPVYGRELFENILNIFPKQSEIAVMFAEEKPIAAALLLHGPGITEVPTASSLREFNSTSANMSLYRQLVDRAIERGQGIFDFGRSTQDGPTFKFKKQWGAVPHPATWQYYAPGGSFDAARPDNPRFKKVIELWQKLPVKWTRLLGPGIVRGIP